MADDYYKEYKELYEQAQTTGLYKVFAFDVKSSKVHSSRDGEKFYNSITNFVEQVTSDLLALEQQTGKQILHRHLELEDIKTDERIADKVVLLRKLTSPENGDWTRKALRIDQFNPLYWLGDAIHFIVNKDSISDDDFFKIFQKNKDKFLPNYDLHYESAYYETDIWAESDEKFSRIYCLPVLDQLMKKSGKIITTPKELKEIPDPSQ